MFFSVFAPLALLLQLLVPIGWCVGAELVLLSPSQFGFTLPNASSSHFFSPFGDKKIFVKLSREFRPVFLALSTLSAPFLYVDQFKNVRSIDRSFIEEFLWKKFSGKVKKEYAKMNPNHLKFKLQNIIEEMVLKVSSSVERSMKFDKDAIIFEHCNKTLTNMDNTTRCLYFFLSESDDQVTFDCSKLHRFFMAFSPRIPTHLLMINQLNFPEMDRWIKQSGRCKSVEQGNPVEKDKAKAEDVLTSTDLKKFFDSNWDGEARTESGRSENE